MPPIPKRKVLRGHGREMVSKVFKFFSKEASENSTKKIKDVRWRTSQATGVPESFITKIIKEKRSPQSSTSSAFPTPSKKSKPREINLTDVDVGAIRRTIQHYYIDYKQPFLDNLKDILKQKKLFDGSITNLRSILFSLGYRWHKTKTGNTLLTEKFDVQWSRFNYLTQIKELRDSGRPIVYADETFIYLSDKDSEGRMRKKDSKSEPEEDETKSKKSPYIIIMHAGSKDGFLPNALKVYNADIQKTGSYVHELSPEGYFKWVKTNLVPNLPKDAVVVMDNATCHNFVAEKIPSRNSTKKEMQSWLSSKGIEYEEEFLSVELYNLIKKNKEKVKSYKVDQLLEAHNFTVVRLPTNHPDLNPFENIWDKLKNYVANLGTEPSSILLTKGFEELNSQWAAACRHVQQIEEEYMTFFEKNYSVIVTDVLDYESDKDDLIEVSDDSNSDIEMS